MEVKNGASGQKANLVWLVLIGIIALQILLEVFAPSLLGMIGLILKYIGLLLVGLLAVACVLLVGYIGVTLFRRLIGGVLRRPMGAAALAVLTLLYCGALFAPAISPYPITQQNLAKPYHPPTGYAWKDGALHAKLSKRSRWFAYHIHSEDATAPIVWFSKVRVLQIVRVHPDGA